MLPFDHKPWARHMAAAVIALTVLAIAATLFYIHSLHPLDTAEITAAILILIAVVPPNIHIIRRKDVPTTTDLNSRSLSPTTPTRPHLPS